MLLFKKITLLFFLFFLFGCDRSGCVNSDAFDLTSVQINAKPSNDKIYGAESDFKQVAAWNDTYLKTNGDKITIYINGGWFIWPSSNNETAEECKFCPKKDGIKNCICYQGEDSAPEIGEDGKKIDTDCKKKENYLNPDKCTCTKTDSSDNQLLATEKGVFSILLNYYNKDGVAKTNDQKKVCKVKAGRSLYIGLFGYDGNSFPIRAYHLFSEETTCDVVKNSKGQCLDADGKDVTKYIYRSPDNKIFMKDDQDGNKITNGSNQNTSNDEYHKSGEYIKLRIYDNYHYDNSGSYDVTFVGGVGKAEESTILENIVSTVEDVILGESSKNTTISSNNIITTVSKTREGGIVKFLYNSIVSDTVFISIIRSALILYVAFYGLATLMGIMEINKKELMSRIYKISLVIFFTSPSSWYYYNQIVVGFFSDSLHYLVGAVMDISDSKIDKTSLIKAAAMNRGDAISNSTRFSYIDIMIKKLFSDAVTMKIWGLFFSDILGLFYIGVIYFLIFYFLYLVSTFAMFYIINLIKIVFVLGLGPIFISFSLFANTNPFFKNWISFLCSRSLEILLIFMILYNFLILIDKNFTYLLAYRACFSTMNFGLFSISIIKSDVNRALAEWIIYFAKLGGLLFITQLIVEKIPSLSEKLISIGGIGSNSSGKVSSMSLGKSVLGDGLKIAGSALSKGLDGAGFAYRNIDIPGMQKIRDLANSATFKLFDKVSDYMIQSRIKDVMAKAKSQGLKGKERDNFVRSQSLKAIREYRAENPTLAKFFNVNLDNLGRCLDKKLIEDPLKKFLKKEAEKINNRKDPNSILLGKDLRRELEKKAKEWAEKNLSKSDHVNSFLKSGEMKSFFRDQNISTKDAAKKFGNDENLKNKYIEHLNNLELKDKVKRDQGGGGFTESLSYFAKKLMGDESKESFISKIREKDKWYEPVNVTGFLKKIFQRDSIGKETEKVSSDAMRNKLMNYNDYLQKTKEGHERKQKESGGDIYLKDKHEQKEKRMMQEREEMKKSLSDFAIKNTDSKRDYLKDEQRVRDKFNSILLDLASTKDPKEKQEKIKNLGGADNIRDGLISLPGESMTLFELSEINKNKKKVETETEDLLKKLKEDLDKTNLKLRELNSSISDLNLSLSKLDKNTIDEQSKTKIESLKDESNGIFNSLPNSSITQLLLDKSPEIGLQSANIANIFLAQEDNANEALKEVIENKKSYLQSKERIFSLEKRILEMEKATLQSKQDEKATLQSKQDEVDKQKIKEIIKEIDKKLDSIDISMRETEKEISNLVSYGIS
jgi:type IV secretory pathway VirB6-like protein